MTHYVEDPYLAWLNDTYKHAETDLSIELNNKEFLGAFRAIAEARRVYLVLIGKPEFP